MTINDHSVKLSTS